MSVDCSIDSFGCLCLTGCFGCLIDAVCFLVFVLILSWLFCVCGGTDVLFWVVGIGLVLRGFVACGCFRFGFVVAMWFTLVLIVVGLPYV